MNDITELQCCIEGGDTDGQDAVTGDQCNADYGGQLISVEVTPIGEPLRRGELAGLCLTDNDGAVFTVRKTNIDGYSSSRRARSISSASLAKKVTPANTPSNTGRLTIQMVHSE